MARAWAALLLLGAAHAACDDYMACSRQSGAEATEDDERALECG